ncbi:hypothetical protein HY478_02395 [Candidatus Uhrbacteria bacterium]|nr:hypothetical protein [Candidatus Uhrbacteria bacterium]
MPRETFQNFSLKFIDIMVGVVLGLGFQWWADLREPWQYIAFIFVYLNLIDYWIDYSPTLKRFPPKHEPDLIVHVFIGFTMFLLVYATRGTPLGFFLTFLVYRIADIWWTINMRRDYRPEPKDLIFINTWLRFDIIEALGAGVLALATHAVAVPPLVLIILFVVFRLLTRALASVRYRKVFFA